MKDESGDKDRTKNPGTVDELYNAEQNTQLRSARNSFYRPCEMTLPQVHQNVANFILNVTSLYLEYCLICVSNSDTLILFNVNLFNKDIILLFFNIMTYLNKTTFKILN